MKLNKFGIGELMASPLAIVLLGSFALSSGASASESSGDSQVLAYQALLDRAPTESDIAYWGQFETDVMLDGIIASEEFRSTGLHPVAATYNNILGRQPSDEAWAYWSPMHYHDSVGVILDSEEFLNVTGLDFELVANKSVEQLIRETFPESPNFALQVAHCESTMRPGAVGDGGDSIGLFQVRWPSHHKKLSAAGITKEMLKQPEYNLIAARMVFDESIAAGRWGWSPWSCAR